MILTEEEIGALFDYGFTTKAELALARAIEQAILDKLQDKLKNSARYEWLKGKSFTEDRDGGYTKNYVPPKVCYCDGYNGYYYNSLDQAIDSAMKVNTCSIYDTEKDYAHY